LAIVLLALAAAAAGATTLKSIGSFEQPIFVTSDPVQPERLFVVERPGRVAEVVDGGAPRLYADLTPLVSCCEGERGLLSIALAPGFHTTGRFYAAYTGKPAAGGSEGDIHVDAFVADSAGGVTRTPILSIPHSLESNHNGGQLQFGPDGHLYISTGDGGGGGDPFESGQSLNTLLGKILRIDPHPGATPAYSVPADNPFAGATPGEDEIWAYGVRNPWRFSFDSLTGDTLIGDVGQGAREEVDLARSPSPGVVGGGGADYGWSCREGFIAYTSPAANCAGASGFVDPIFDYPHTDPEPAADLAYGCAITGGYVVRDPGLSDLYGRYVYADYCTSEIRSLRLPAGAEPAQDSSAGIATSTPNPVSFGEDSCHRIYVVSGSNVFRFEGPTPTACPEIPEQGPPAGEAHSPPPTSLGPVAAEGANVRVSARRRGDRLLLTVRVAPCPTWAGGLVQLNRGGEEAGKKRLDGGCRAVFRRPAPERASFRVLLVAGSGQVFRSRRLLIDPSHG
jgi:hypothetical protein